MDIILNAGGAHEFLKMGQHGVTGWWPVIFAMLGVLCLCPEKI
jgi:hypothetical protein